MPKNKKVEQQQQNEQNAQNEVKEFMDNIAPKLDTEQLKGLVDYFLQALKGMQDAQQSPESRPSYEIVNRQTTEMSLQYVDERTNWNEIIRPMLAAEYDNNKRVRVVVELMQKSYNE